MIAHPSGRHRFRFVVTILTGSFLLFLVQPMIARIALPRLGGAPAVWNSAMLVYQALLLGGYCYAHLLTRLPPRRQAIVHLGVLLLAALTLPIGLADRVMPADAEPAFWVPYLFALSIGPLFFAVSAQAPLMQRWFGYADPAADPYPLYAASNLGSFAGLIAFPLIVEPLLPVSQQRWLWSAGYLLLVAFVASCLPALPGRAAAVTAQAHESAPDRRRIATWIALSTVPSGLMLASSTFISTDLIAMPLLWVIPLALYLLSFSVAFATDRTLADWLTRAAPITLLLFGGVLMGDVGVEPLFGAGMALALLFMVAVALHTRLYRLRPDPARLTGFYLASAVGGALGGIFAGLVAPVLFDWTWEYPMLMLAAAMLLPQQPLTAGLRRVWANPANRHSAITLGAIVVMGLIATSLISGGLEVRGHLGALFLVIAVLGLLSIGARVPYILVLTASLLLFGGLRSLTLSLEPGARVRSYFGIYTVNDEPRRRTLIHGNTLHGVQLTGSMARERTPTTYYTPDSGVGQAMTLAPALYGPTARIGVVGLGTGTLACYAKPGQRWRFYEIDPTMVALAQHGRFTFLRDCAPGAAVIVGDARLSLERQGSATLDLLVLDAFSSDAVPMHLLTLQAFATYGRVLAPRGLLMVHVSNRFLNLQPVVAGAAAASGWRAAILNHVPFKDEEEASRSAWIAMSRDPAVLAQVTANDPDWRALYPRAGFANWTDDYATILPLLKF